MCCSGKEPGAKYQKSPLQNVCHGYLFLLSYLLFLMLYRYPDTTDQGKRLEHNYIEKHLDVQSKAQSFGEADR